MKMVKYCFVLLSFVLVCFLIGCTSHPQISIDNVNKDIVGKSTGEGIMSWAFEKNEPRDISIKESTYSGDKGNLIIDIKTSGGLGRTMSGKLRLYYEWITNEWNLVRVENISFKQI